MTRSRDPITTPPSLDAVHERPSLLAQFVLDMDQAKPEKQSEVDLAFWLALVALNSVVWGGVLLIVWWSL
jgi:hypothetical protein